MFFYLDRVGHDFLSKNIFEAIQEKEKESGYRPELFSGNVGGKFVVLYPTNYLGERTHYFWCATTDQEKGAVLIKALFVEKEPLLEVVENYDVR